MEPELELGCGAILSGEIASRRQAIRYASRSQPVDEADSGWQFTAGPQYPLSLVGVQIWALGEVVKLEPSLERYMGLPAGTVLNRVGHSDVWIDEWTSDAA